jgi:glycerol-3-phosphate dehydrogenase (NAD(P)+)
MSAAPSVAILGAGNMGTALAQVCALNGCSVVLWDHFPDVVTEINQQRCNSRYLPGVPLAPNITAVTSPVVAVRAVSLIVLAVPSPFIRATLDQALSGCAAGAVFLNVAKGIEAATREPIHVGVARQLNGRPLVLLAGPAIANEFARGLPAAVVLASESSSNAERVRALFEGNIFRVTTTTDVTGAALGGILKNVYAILLGYVATAVGESRNLEAAVLNALLREMAMLGLALGAKQETLFGLAGLGDLVATGFSDDSHNRRFGRKLGAGRTREEIQRETPLLPEGARTVDIACAWAAAKGIRVPLAEFVRRLVAGTRPALGELLREL